MAIAYVSERGTLDTITGTGNTQAVTVSSTCTASNRVLLIFVCRRTAGTSGITVTDSRSNTWAVDYIGNATTNQVFVASTVQNIGTLQAGDTVTVTWASDNGANSRKALLEEFSGLATLSYIDKTVTSTGATSPGTVGPTAATTQADELVVAAWCWDAGSFPALTGDAAYSDFTTSTIDCGGNPADLYKKSLHAEYKIVSATGTQSSTITSGGTTNSWSGIIVTFTVAAAAPARTQNLLLLGVG